MFSNEIDNKPTGGMNMNRILCLYYTRTNTTKQGDHSDELADFAEKIKSEIARK